MFRKMMDDYFRSRGGSNGSEVIHSVEMHLKGLRERNENADKKIRGIVQRNDYEDLSEKYSLLISDYTEGAYMLGFSDAFSYIREVKEYSRKHLREAIKRTTKG